MYLSVSCFSLLCYPFYKTTNTAYCRMKASIKFRDDQRPLFKVKLPFCIFGLPIQSGFLSGEKKEFCLTFNPLFKKGPSFKLSYHPNDSCNHLTFGIKAVVGQFGFSPANAPPIIISAELNLQGANGSPTFFLHFRPQLGDFSIRRTLQSRFSNPCKPQIQDSGEKHEKSVITCCNVVRTMFSGLEVNARTAVPVRNRAVVKFQWNVKLQDCDPMAAEINYCNMAIMPCLILNKVGIEYVAGNGEELDQENVNNAEACLAVKKEQDLSRRGKLFVKERDLETKSEINRRKDLTVNEVSGVVGTKRCLLRKKWKKLVLGK